VVSVRSRSLQICGIDFPDGRTNSTVSALNSGEK
jgi:hypothetical protein